MKDTNISQSGLVEIKVKKENNTYSFLMPMSSPLGESYDAAFAVLREIVAMSESAAKRAERQSESESEEPESKGSSDEAKG